MSYFKLKEFFFCVTPICNKYYLVLHKVTFILYLVCILFVTYSFFSTISCNSLKYHYYGVISVGKQSQTDLK